MPKCPKDCNTPKVLEIHNHECPVLFHRVLVPAAIGDDETNPPRNGQYRNVLLVYEANDHVYLFSSDGIPTFISDGGQGVDDYNELENKPSINGHELIGDSSLEDLGVDEAISDALEDYTPTSELAEVALSGDYNDLSNTPTIPVVNDATLTITRNNVSAGTFTANSATNTSINIAVPTATSDLTNDSGFITNTVNNLVNYYTKTETDTAIGVETSNRENADQGLQEQIDALASASDVVDVVGTYAELQAYDTSHLNDNDIIKVLTDETHNNAISYYRWDTDTGTFSYIGSQGPFYTKAESDATFVPQTRTVNNKALSTNITLTASDVGALPDSTSIPTRTSDLINDGADNTSTYVEADELATVATSGSYNDLSNKPTIPAAQVNSDWNAVSGVAQILNKPTIPTATSQLTNDSGFITTSALSGYLPLAGGTLTGKLTGTQIETGTAAANYFQSRKFRGEGDASSYYHAVDFGYAGHNQVDFYEYGGAWNFWRNMSATATTDTNNLALGITRNALKNKSYTYTFPNKTGTFALTSDIPSVPTVNNGQLTIQKNGSNVATFTANASSNVTANISVPTATSDLTNDSGFITSITKITNAEIDAIMGVS